MFRLSITSLLLITALAYGYAQPTTLCGYELGVSIFEVDPGIIKYINKDKTAFYFASEDIVFVTDIRLRIVAIQVKGERVNIEELGVTLPCEAKRVLEILGTPTDNTDEDIVFNYDIGTSTYVIAANKSAEDPNIINRITLTYVASESRLEEWIKQTQVPRD